MLYNRVNILYILITVVTSCCLYLVLSKKHKHHHSFIEIDIYANKSDLRLWNPKLKILFALAMLTISVCSKHIWIPIYIFILLSVFTIYIGKINLVHYISFFNVPLNFAMISLISILISFSNIPNGVLSIPFGNIFLTVTKTSQKEALAIISRVLGSLSCLYMINLTTPLGEIIDFFKYFKTPNIIIDLMYLIYRYIFILLKTLEDLSHAAHSRLGYINYKTSIKTIGLIALNIFFISLKKASDSFDAMESRLYQVENIRFLNIAKPIQPKHVCMYILSFVPIILYITWSII